MVPCRVIIPEHNAQLYTDICPQLLITVQRDVGPYTSAYRILSEWKVKQSLGSERHEEVEEMTTLWIDIGRTHTVQECSTKVKRERDNTRLHTAERVGRWCDGTSEMR